MIERTFPFNVLHPYTRERATQLVQCINRFSSNCYYMHGSTHINGRSLLGVLAMMSFQDEELTIRIEGEDQEAAYEALEGLLLENA